MPGWWEDDNEKLNAMAPSSWLKRFPPVGITSRVTRSTGLGLLQNIEINMLMREQINEGKGNKNFIRWRQLTLLHSGRPKLHRVLTRKSGVLGSIPGLATYFRFSFRFFKKGSCQLLAKVCARSTG